MLCCNIYVPYWYIQYRIHPARPNKPTEKLLQLFQDLGTLSWKRIITSTLATGKRWLRLYLNFYQQKYLAVVWRLEDWITCHEHIGLELLLRTELSGLVSVGVSITRSAGGSLLEGITGSPLPLPESTLGSTGGLSSVSPVAGSAASPLRSSPSEDESDEELESSQASSSSALWSWFGKHGGWWWLTHNFGLKKQGFRNLNQISYSKKISAIAN